MKRKKLSPKVTEEKQPKRKSLFDFIVEPPQSRIKKLQEHQCNRKKLTPKFIDTLELMIYQGCWLETAVAMTGIDTKTYRSWLKKGNQSFQKGEDNLYTALYLTIERAMSYAEHSALEIIRNAAQGVPQIKEKKIYDSRGNIVETFREESIKIDWKASAWFLERRYPNKWGMIQREAKFDHQSEEEKYSEMRKLVGKLKELAGPNKVHGNFEEENKDSA